MWVRSVQKSAQHPSSRFQDGRATASKMIGFCRHIYRAGVFSKQIPYSRNRGLTGDVSLDCCQYKQILAEVKFGFGRSLRGSARDASVSRGGGHG